MQPISFGAMLRIKRTPEELWEKKGKDNYKQTGTFPEQPLYINPDQVIGVRPQITREDVYDTSGGCRRLLRDVVTGVSGTIIYLSGGEKIKLDSPTEKVVIALHKAKTSTDGPYIDLTA